MSVGDQQIHAQAAAVLHDCVAAVAEFGFRIGGVPVGSVGTFLFLAIHHPGAVATGLGWFAVLGLNEAQASISVPSAVK